MTGRSEKAGKGRLAVKFLIGLFVGAAGAALFLTLAGRSGIDLDDPATMFAVTVGLVYTLIGLMAGAGVLAPRQGALFLNVEDAGEIREQRASLGPSAVGCILVGLFLIVLGLAPGGETSGRAVAAAIALACIAGTAGISLAAKGRTDELMKHVSREASALTLHAALLILAVWAALAHLGYVGWLGPLTAVAGVASLQLLAIFWVSARRGLMKPR